jgi:hypothetical protein
MRRIAFFLGLVTVFAAIAQAATATDGAVITRQTFTRPFSDTGLTDGCLPGATGTIAGTANFSFQMVVTSTELALHATEIDTGRIDWSNGDYTIIGSTDHASFHRPNPPTGQQAVFTDAHQDFGDVYSADGTFLFRETFHNIEHFTISNGVTQVSIDMGHFHVFGSDCTPA